MQSRIFKYLKAYSTEPIIVDRLIVSAFIDINKINVTKNKFLKYYNINSDSELEYNKLQEFITILLSEFESFSFEFLIELFEFVISPKDRVINGAVYTPWDIRKWIIDASMERVKIEVYPSIKVADIACGCGGFLIDVSKKIREITSRSYKEIFKSNIYGIDIQEYSITRTKILLLLLAVSENEDEEEFCFNLYTGNTLNFDWKSKIPEFRGFNCIVGNPPYIRYRNLDHYTRGLLKNWEVCGSGLTDLYIPFFQIGIENLCENGMLGYITMNSFFKSLNGRALREYIQKSKFYLEIYDFGSEQIFKSRSTYTCICFVQNIKDKEVHYSLTSRKSLKSLPNTQAISYDELIPKTGWNFQNIDNIRKIEKIGTPLKKLYKMRHGLATLKNSVYIFTPIEENEEYYHFTKHGITHKIEKEICRDAVNPNILKSEDDLTKATEKIIFPYTQDSNPKLFDEENIKKNFPYAYKYLVENRDILALRDRGNGKYENWYAFGRRQSLEKTKAKLFFPKISNKPIKCIISSDENLLHYNGLAIIADSIDELYVIKGIIESNYFWYYIKSTSKPYNSAYYSLNGNYINNFGIPSFTETEKEIFRSDKNGKTIQQVLDKKYGFVISHK
jgi:adenine-specific DNA-methyltransferase